MLLQLNTSWILIVVAAAKRAPAERCALLHGFLWLRRRQIHGLLMISNRKRSRIGFVSQRFHHA